MGCGASLPEQADDGQKPMRATRGLDNDNNNSNDNANKNSTDSNNKNNNNNGNTSSVAGGRSHAEKRSPSRDYRSHVGTRHDEKSRTTMVNNNNDNDDGDVDDGGDEADDELGLASDKRRRKGKNRPAEDDADVERMHQQFLTMTDDLDNDEARRKGERRAKRRERRRNRDKGREGSDGDSSPRNQPFRREATQQQDSSNGGYDGYDNDDGGRRMGGHPSARGVEGSKDEAAYEEEQYRLRVEREQEREQDEQERRQQEEYRARLLAQQELAAEAEKERLRVEAEKKKKPAVDPNAAFFAKMNMNFDKSKFDKKENTKLVAAASASSPPPGMFAIDGTTNTRSMNHNSHMGINNNHSSTNDAELFDREDEDLMNAILSGS